MLGINWDYKGDILELDLTKLEQGSVRRKPTKRGILSNLAMIFDPLGIISPVLVNAKVMFQELCQNKLGWDDPIPTDKELRW